MPTHDKVLRAIRKAAAAKHLTHTRVRLPDLKPPYWAVVQVFSEYHSEVVYKNHHRFNAQDYATNLINEGKSAFIKEVKP